MSNEGKYKEEFSEGTKHSCTHKIRILAQFTRATSFVKLFVRNDSLSYPTWSLRRRGKRVKSSDSSCSTCSTCEWWTWRWSLRRSWFSCSLSVSGSELGSSRRSRWGKSDATLFNNSWSKGFQSATHSVRTPLKIPLGKDRFSRMNILNANISEYTWQELWKRSRECSTYNPTSPKTLWVELRSTSTLEGRSTNVSRTNRDVWILKRNFRSTDRCVMKSFSRYFPSMQSLHSILMIPRNNVSSPTLHMRRAGMARLDHDHVESWHEKSTRRIWAETVLSAKQNWVEIGIEGWIDSLCCAPSSLTMDGSLLWTLHKSTNSRNDHQAEAASHQSYQLLVEYPVSLGWKSSSLVIVDQGNNHESGTVSVDWKWDRSIHSTKTEPIEMHRLNRIHLLQARLLMLTKGGGAAPGKIFFFTISQYFLTFFPATFYQKKTENLFYDPIYCARPSCLTNARVSSSVAVCSFVYEGDIG